MANSSLFGGFNAVGGTKNSNNQVKQPVQYATPGPFTKSKLFQDCPEADIRVLKEAAAKVVAQPASVLLHSPLSTKWSHLTTGCSALDNCLRGGIVTRGITEICGASGVGKTQLLLQLSLTVQLPTHLGGLGKAVAFVCTEDAFPSKRLFQLAKVFEKRFPENQTNYMGNIFIEHVLEADDLLQCVGARLANLMESVSIGLIIIDSVAAIFRTYNNYIKRARDMRNLANHLLHYADKYNCAVVCVNQVATASDAAKETPCLGLAWAHLGRTRIKLSKVPKEVKINDDLFTIRRFEIVYSPDTPNEVAEFLITAGGVVDVPV
ncbi:DNA repair protein XRCC3 homolog [Rhagoletis pomonella]|uniref:DNA repair protein XRCC3 homolog n=1 Tax=Rhagoletis pomonella TaxID=28610 RepID=UPI00177EC69B|nr:DNA repair protein XRCC3 homolog [Rhagoletis pomonella]